MFNTFRTTLAIPVAFAPALSAPVVTGAQSLADPRRLSTTWRKHHARPIGFNCGRGSHEELRFEVGKIVAFVGSSRLSHCVPGTDLRLAVPCRSISSTTGPSAFLGSNRTGIRSTMSLTSGTAAMYGVLSERLEPRAIRT